MTTQRITAVVVVHGSPAETVGACLQSLLDSVNVDVHIVLVDNASPDGGAACRPWRSHPAVTLVTSDHNDGFAAGVNQGLGRRRSGDLIWLLNDDATVLPNALFLCASALSTHPSAVAVAPRVMLANEPDLIDSIGIVVRPNGEAFNAFIGQRWNNQVANGDEVLGPCFGAAMFRPNAFASSVCRNDNVGPTGVCPTGGVGPTGVCPTGGGTGGVGPNHSVGPIDERYRLYYEDVDWSLRARRAGFTTVAATDAVVFHQHAASTRLLGEAKRYGLVQRNLLLCVAKNFSVGAAAGAWRGRLVVHAKGVITGPYRVERVRSIGWAVVGLTSALAARSRRPAASPDYDEAAVFTFARGQSPNFSTKTYRADTSPTDTSPTEPTSQ